MELQRNSHHVFRLMYHFVWIPKYRHKVFMEPYRSELKGIIGKIGYDIQYRDCGIRDSSGSHSYGSENGSEDFASVCHAGNKKHQKCPKI